MTIRKWDLSRFGPKMMFFVESQLITCFICLDMSFLRDRVAGPGRVSLGVRAPTLGDPRFPGSFGGLLCVPCD